VITVAMLWRSQLRRRWRSWALLTVLLGIGVGAGMACVAGARRAQSMTPIVVSVALALSLGTALGRWWWRLLAEMIGVVDSAAVPVAALGAVAALVVVAAGLIAIVPGVRAARTPAAVLLRGE
jgi:hypothetical protein